MIGPSRVICASSKLTEGTLMELKNEKYGAGEETVADDYHAPAWDNIAVNERLRCITQDTKATTKISTPVALEIKEWIGMTNQNMQEHMEGIQRNQESQMNGRGDNILDNVNYPRPMAHQTKG